MDLMVLHASSKDSIHTGDVQADLCQVRIQRGDRASGPPPGKSQIIWVSIGNKQLDPPPPPGKCYPLWNLEK